MQLEPTALQASQSAPLALQATTVQKGHLPLIFVKLDSTVPLELDNALFVLKDTIVWLDQENLINVKLEAILLSKHLVVQLVRLDTTVP